MCRTYTYVHTTHILHSAHAHSRSHSPLCTVDCQTVHSCQECYPLPQQPPGEERRTKMSSKSSAVRTAILLSQTWTWPLETSRNVTVFLSEGGLAKRNRSWYLIRRLVFTNRLIVYFHPICYYTNIFHQIDSLQKWSPLTRVFILYYCDEWYLFWNKANYSTWNKRNERIIYFHLFYKKYILLLLIYWCE